MYIVSACVCSVWYDDVFYLIKLTNKLILSKPLTQVILHTLILDYTYNLVNVYRYSDSCISVCQEGILTSENNTCCDCITHLHTGKCRDNANTNTIMAV